MFLKPMQKYFSILSMIILSFYSKQGCLPRQVLFPFIALHSRTLKKLILKVGVPAEPGDEIWVS